MLQFFVFWPFVSKRKCFVIYINAALVSFPLVVYDCVAAMSHTFDKKHPVGDMT